MTVGDHKRPERTRSRWFKRAIEWRLKTLRSRLMLLITVVLLVVVGLPVALFVYQLDRNYYEFSTDLLEITSNVVFEKVHAGMVSDVSTIDSRLEDLALETSIQLTRIYKPSGTIVFSSVKEEIGQNIFEMPVGETISGDEHVIKSFNKSGNVYSHHHPLYVQAECLECHANEGELIGILDVYARSPQSEQVYTYAKNLSVTGGILIIVILILITNLVYEGQIERRLRIILKGFDELSLGRLDSKIQMPGEHELAQIADRFNSTVEKLKEAREKEDEFYREKLEHADRLVTLGEIAAEIAHEVNNPAGIILSRAELMKDELHDSNGMAGYHDDLEVIVQQTARISEITRSILHYAQKRPRSFSQIDLNEVIRHAMTVMGPLIRKRDATVDLDFPSEPALTWGSPSQLEQVFCNLVNNSLDAVSGSKEANSIKIVLKNSGDDRDFYVVEFTDNGPGISPEYSEEIFSPFFTTKRNEDGTGLGLFICRNIINNHGGSIHLDTTSPAGARFVIEFARFQVPKNEAIRT